MWSLPMVKFHEDTVFIFFKIRTIALAFIIIDTNIVIESRISVGKSLCNVTWYFPDMFLSFRWLNMQSSLKK